MAGRVAVLYHYPCPDGAFAALAAHLYHTLQGLSVVFFPNTVYSPIKVKDLDTDAFDAFYLLDFVGPEGFAMELCSKAKKVIVLDHHKTAYDALLTKSHDNLLKNIDLKRSGATIAFDYFTDKLKSDFDSMLKASATAGKGQCGSLTLVDQSSLPRIRRIFDYIEDADLWKWNLPHSKAFSNGLGSLRIDYNSNSNSDLFQQLLSLDPLEVIATGEKQLLLNQIRLDAALQNSFVINLGQESFGQCLAVEDDHMADLRSDLGNQLAARSLALGLRPIGAVVYKVDEVDTSLVKVSLRSTEGQDTTEISQAYGGGGHAGASSFMISKKRFNDWKCKGLSLAGIAAQN
eukprot:c135_g1_i1 orf=410-1447(-)